MPEGQENSTAKRGELEARIAELQQMNGQPVELVRQAQQAVDVRRAEIADIEGQISALDSQTGARAKQQREDAERARLSERDRMRQELVKLHDERLQTLRDAEAGARQLASKVKELLSLNKEVASLSSRLSGQRRVPGALAENDLVNRIGGRISALMMKIGQPYSSRLGGISWAAGPSSFYPTAEDWAAAEEKRLAPDLENILKPEKE